MKRLAGIFAVFVVLATAPAAYAEATRTWVSGVGDDANPCSRTAPCKTWAGAISKTAAGGEIDALDPGGFGSVTITKAITLNGRGTHASVLSASFNGIVVQAGANDVVALKHLSINGVGTGLVGIKFNSGKALHVLDVEAQDHNGSPGVGLLIGGTGARVTVTDSHFDNNVYGILGSGTGMKLTVTNSTLDGNSAIGVVANGLNSSTTLRNVSIQGPGTPNNVGAQGQYGARMTLDHCLITGNDVGIQDDGGGSGGSYIRVSNSQISENSTGLSVTATGQILTNGTNMVFDNGANGVFTGTFASS
jgi:hypothetical protein